jgi:hypothetical protein
MPIGPSLDAIENHAGQTLDSMHLACAKDDGGARAQPHLLVSVVEETLAFKDVIDLVGPRMGMDGEVCPGSQPTTLIEQKGVSARNL